MLALATVTSLSYTRRSGWEEQTVKVVLADFDPKYCCALGLQNKSPTIFQEIVGSEIKANESKRTDD